MSVSNKAPISGTSSTTIYGLQAVPVGKLVSDAAAISEIMPLLESNALPLKDRLPTDEFWKVTRVFSAVASQADPCWFTYSEMLGHPAPELARRVLQHLGNFPQTIKQQNTQRFHQLTQAFDDDRGFEMLDSYLDVAARGQEPVVEDKMAFITSVPGAFSLRIDACEGSVRDHLSNLVREQGFSQQGRALLGSWLIHDVSEVQEAIKSTFEGEAMASGQYFVKEQKAKATLEAILKHTNNFVLSPWHLDDEPVPSQAPTP